MIGSRDRVDVILDVYTEDDAYRVRMVGVFQPGQPTPPVPPGATRNIVQTFHDDEVTEAEAQTLQARWDVEHRG